MRDGHEHVRFQPRPSLTCRKGPLRRNPQPGPSDSIFGSICISISIPLLQESKDKSIHGYVSRNLILSCSAAAPLSFRALRYLPVSTIYDSLAFLWRSSKHDRLYRNTTLV
jgi:hypothetical protein